MAKCVVLGANGFIGSHLVDKLIDAGHEVRAFGRFSGGVLFHDSPNVELFYGDFLNKADLRKALKDVSYVFHFVSTTIPLTSENDPLIDVETNVRVTVELLQECVEAKVKRVIFASTGGAIYGNIGDTPHVETDTPLPVSPYAIGKLTIEHYLRYFNVKHGLDSIALRISNPYGERQPLHRKQGVIPIFLENIALGRPVTVLGDGSMVRDYLYVKDLATMIEGMFDKEAKEMVYNIGSGHGTSLNQLLSLAEEVCNKKVEVIHKPVPSTFVQRAVLNTERFSKEFGIVPQTTLREGLETTSKYIQAEITRHG